MLATVAVSDNCIELFLQLVMPGNPLDSSLVKILNVTRRSFKRCETRGSAICRFRGASVLLLLLLWTVALTPSQGFSQADPEDSGPLLLSISPLTEQPGKLLKV